MEGKEAPRAPARSRAFALAALATGATLGVMIAQDPLRARLRIALALLACGAATVTWAFALRWSRRSGRRNGVATVAGIVWAVLATVLLGEAWFANVDRSHSVNYTLAGRLWLDRHYWGGLNSYGHRDPEPVPERFTNARRRVFVMGDSFAAGHGVDDPRDRFSDRLQARLPPGCLVANLAISGLDSRKELANLRAFPWRPHVLVLSYFGNDIMEAAQEAGFAPPSFQPYADLGPPARFAVERSYLLNAIYWGRPRSDLGQWWSYFDDVWKSPQVRELHERDLDAFVEFSRVSSCRLVVVLFPFLHDVERSEGLYVGWVRRVFASRGVPIVDVLPLVKDLPLKERIATVNDMHASVRVHALVAEELEKIVRPWVE